MCMACRAARKHRKRLINERKQENSLHTSMKNGVQLSVQGVPKVCSARRNDTPFPWRTSSASDFSGGASELFELISAHKRAEIGSEQG